MVAATEATILGHLRAIAFAARDAQILTPATDTEIGAATARAHQAWRELSSLWEGVAYRPARTPFSAQEVRQLTNAAYEVNAALSAITRHGSSWAQSALVQDRCDLAPVLTHVRDHVSQSRLVTAALYEQTRATPERDDLERWPRAEPGRSLLPDVLRPASELTRATSHLAQVLEGVPADARTGAIAPFVASLARTNEDLAILRARLATITGPTRSGGTPELHDHHGPHAAPGGDGRPSRGMP